MKKRNKCISRHLHPDPEHWVRKGQSWKAKVMKARMMLGSF